MLFSYKLLSELVDLTDLTPAQLADRLTFTGFEVEGMKPLAQASKLVIGHVLSCVKHPDSDHLHVLKVQAGPEGVLDIVCGAPNVAAGENVIVALPGCVLPAIQETIKASEIRGAASNGMCCSLSELGVDKAGQSEADLAGIHVLPAEAPIGSYDVLKYLGLDDTILDISILPNRPDCLCHLGLAREISSIFSRKYYGFKSVKLPSRPASVEVSSLTPGCDKFLLAELNGLKEGPTPLKASRYLMSLGIRSVSKIVDLGNYAMVLTGQPLHMYDLDKVEGGKLTAQDGYEGGFVALDDKEYKLIKGDIVIADEKKPCCLAGVMGSKAVAVDEKTTHVGIEAAHFYHAAIRHTSSRLGLISDSSSLFTKGVNPYLTQEALGVTLAIAEEFFPEAKLSGVSSYDKVGLFTGTYPFSEEKLNKRLGANYTSEEISQILNRLYLVREGEALKKDPHRLDLLEQCDIDEEVFRLSDQKSIQLSLEKIPQTAGALSEKQTKEEQVRNGLLYLGLDEIITYTLLNAKLEKAFRVFNSGSYKVMHPLTEDHEYVRSDLASSMLAALDYNLGRKNDDLGLFEISPIDSPDGNHLYLSFGLHGSRFSRGMLESHKADFYDAKGIIERIMDVLGLDERRYTLRRSVNSAFHPGRSADIFIGKTLVGTFGETNPASDHPDFVLGEVDLGLLISQKTSKLKAQPLSALQPIRRDLAFKLNSPDVSSADIIREIKKAGGKYVVKSEVFDVFSKEGATYMAFATTFIKEDKSFTDAELNSLLNTIILNVTHTLKVELRS
jgi:phenylalanyl-tRNA synthetase beta chain